MPVQNFVSPTTQTENQIEFHVSSLRNKLTEVMISVVYVCMVCVTLLKKCEREKLPILQACIQTHTHIYIYIYIEREREGERIPSQQHTHI